MRLALIVVVGIAGCGAKPRTQSPVENVEREEAPRLRIRDVPKTATMERPAIDINAFAPDFHDELRWPLSAMAHPSLEPQFPIARELANGVEWETLCARGVHKRVSATQRELLAYLHGWCDVLKRDVDGALEHLVPLLGSTRLGLPAAVRHDLANILVDSGNAEIAEHYLSKHDIRDIEVLDLLAASYAELGRSLDAVEINRRAIDSDGAPRDATRCYRLVKRIVFAGETLRYASEELATMATQPKVPDPRCVRMHHKVACRNNPGPACAPYLADENLDKKAMHLLEAYYRWPKEADASGWWRIADTATWALPLPGAADLVITAHEAALRVLLQCKPEYAISIHHAVAQIRTIPDHAAYEPRLQKLEAACPYKGLPQAVAASRRPRSVAPWPSPPAKP